MAAPTLSQVQEVVEYRKRLHEAAIDEFLSEVDDSMTYEEVMEEAARIYAKYRMLGAELGAQWYDLCAELAGVSVEKAEIDFDFIDFALEDTIKAFESMPPDKTIEQFFDEFMQSQIDLAFNTTGMQNLDRDYLRGVRGGRWARVPVGETCAWCIMLAANGAWYKSEETALREEAGKFHRNCDCVAVYYANAEDIADYAPYLAHYKAMYYAADNMRKANLSGEKPYSKELKLRIANAKAEHDASYKAGYTDRKWSVVNEDMIIMRELFGLK